MMQLLQQISKVIFLFYPLEYVLNRNIIRKHTANKSIHLFSFLKIILYLFIVFGISTPLNFAQNIRQADYYFDFENGNNSNNGLTPQTAKKDISGFTGLGSNIAGKTIAFRDSMYYRGTLTLNQSNVNVTNWYEGGSDKLPMFTPSTAVTDWTNSSGNVWQASAGSAAAVWLVFPEHHTFGQDSAFWGIPQASIGELNREGEYYISGSTMYIYAPSDPDSYYESVNRSSGGSSAINVTSSSTDCKLSYVEAFGVDGFVLLVNHGADNTIVEYSSFHHCGSWADIEQDGGGGSGHAIGLRGSGSIVRYSKTWEGSNHGIHVYSYGAVIENVIIEHTAVYNNHHTGIDYNGAHDVRNITVRYCYVYETGYSRERDYISTSSRQIGIWQQGSMATNNTYAYNLLVNSSRGNMVLNGTGNQVYNTTSINTIPQVAGGTSYSFQCGSGSVARNNIRVHAVGGNISASTSSNNINYILGGSGTNPQLMSLSAGMLTEEINAHLQATSPAIDYGMDVGYSFDMDGNPVVGNPDAGVYEYTAGGGGNNPPNVPSNPNPSNGATNQPLNVTVSWNCSDPDGDPLTYDVYFGTNSNPPVVSTNQSSTNYNPGQLINSTTYYWKIVARDNQGASRNGPVWNFTTEGGITNNPPNQPSSPNPPSGSTNQPINLTLSWNCSDPDGDPLTYDVYFGTNSNPPVVSTNQSGTNYNPNQLNNSTTYYWKIIARDNQGASTTGPVWNFSTVSGPDITPPEVIGAQLENLTTLKVLFSEPLEQTGAQNVNNYSITNGISINSASLDGSEVTLITSDHTEGAYTVTVNNVTDLAGNSINPNNNSAQYEATISQVERLIIVQATASVVPEPEHSPDKTIDGLGYNGGDPDSRWAGDTMPEWMMFDLGSVSTVNLLKLSFYNWNTGRIYTYSVETSNDLSQWNPVISNATSSTVEWTEDVLNSIQARYVRVYFLASNQNSWAGLWETEIWGLSGTTGNNETEPEVITDYSLEQNYPNPFNPSTNISFNLPTDSQVKLSIYNLLGEQIVELINSELSAGNHSVTFNAEGLTSGIYLYRIEANEFFSMKKMILLK